MGADDSYSIDELARAAGMTARNVRAYRTKGLLPPPVRSGRASEYRTAHLDRLRNIRDLRDAGLPLKLIIEAARRGEDLGPAGPLRLLAVGTVGTVGTATGTVDLTGVEAASDPETTERVISDPAVYATIQRLRELGLQPGLALVIALRVAQRSADLARDVTELLTVEAPGLTADVRGEVVDLVIRITGDVVRQGLDVDRLDVRRLDVRS